jgi:hypothetical protein
MNSNAYQIVWIEEDEEASECFASGFTIAEVDEKFAKLYPDATVVQIELLGEFVDDVA